MQLYLVIFYAVDWVAMMLQKDSVPFLYKCFLVEMSTAVIINMILNFFWAYLIIAQLIRILRRGKEAETTFEGSDAPDTKADDLNETAKNKREEIEIKQILDPAQPASDIV